MSHSAPTAFGTRLRCDRSVSPVSGGGIDHEYQQIFGVRQRRIQSVLVGSRVEGCERLDVLRHEDDLAAGVAAFKLSVGIADLRQRVDFRDR